MISSGRNVMMWKPDQMFIFDIVSHLSSESPERNATQVRNIQWEYKIEFPRRNMLIASFLFFCDSFVCLFVPPLMSVLFCLCSFHLSPSINVYFLIPIQYLLWLFCYLIHSYLTVNKTSFLFSFAIISFEMFLLNYFVT